MIVFVRAHHVARSQASIIVGSKSIDRGRPLTPFSCSWSARGKLVGGTVSQGLTEIDRLRPSVLGIVKGVVGCYGDSTIRYVPHSSLLQPIFVIYKSEG